MQFPEYARAIAARRRSNLITLRQTASTHLLGRRIVEEYDREDLRVPAADLVAWSQTAGVGRDGRSWSSPAGQGVYMTAIRSLESAEQVQRLPLAVAVSLCETVDGWLRAVGGGDSVCRLKWPNDLCVGNRKLGGILIDVVSSPARRRALQAAAAVPRTAVEGAEKVFAILSVGVNVGRDLAAFEHSRATSVAVEAERRGRSPVSLAEAAAGLLGAIDAGIASDSSRVLEAYRRFSLHRPGDRMRCRLDSGTVIGTFLGFDGRGFLRLRAGGQDKLLRSGVIVDED